MHDRGRNETVFILYLLAVFLGGLFYVAHHYHNDEVGARAVLGAAACFVAAEIIVWRARRGRGRPR
jgi:Na+/H+ antiporter NhaD/arsenite permease-like protein